MPLLSAADIQSFSNLATSVFFDDTCYILRNTGLADGNAGYKADASNWLPTTQTPIPCCVADSGNPGAQLLETTQFGKVQKLVLLPPGTDVKDNDRIQTLSNNVYYKVIAANDPQSYEVVRRATVQRYGSGVNL